MTKEAVFTTREDRYFEYQKVFEQGADDDVVVFGRKVTRAGNNVRHESTPRPLTPSEEELFIDFDAGIIYSPINIPRRPY